MLQDMIENVLEIKDTYVREVMTPLVDVVASDSSATLVDFHALWVTHQYSRCVIIFLCCDCFFNLFKPAKNIVHAHRVPVFEQRVDNIVGIAYAMDLLDYVQKVRTFYYYFTSYRIVLYSLVKCSIFISVLKGDLLESSTVGDMAHKPAYFVPGIFLLFYVPFLHQFN